MRIRTLKYAAVALALVLAPLSASASTITEIGAFGPSPTNVGISDTSQTFTDFLSAGAPAGAILQSVTISESFTVGISSLEITNLDNTLANAVPESFYYLAQVGFGVGGTAAADDLTALANGLPTPTMPVVLFSVGDSFTTGAQSIDRNGVLVYIGSPAIPTGGVQGTPDPSLVGAYSANEGNGLFDSSGAEGTTDLTPFTFTTSITSSSLSSYDTTGTFSLGYLTSTNLQLQGAGGNIGFSQTTVTSGTFEVDYNYELAGEPEPATWILMGSALAGLLAYRRRAVA